MRVAGGSQWSKGPVPSMRQRTSRAGMEPSRFGAANACRVVVSTPANPRAARTAADRRCERMLTGLQAGQYGVTRPRAAGE